MPNFIGIGAPKAATTWLSRCLAEHPDVFVAASKEVTFLDYASIDNRWAEYCAHFVGAERASAIGEFTTRYLASKRVAPRIKEHLPEARLLVSLRNPIEQVYSHYWHLQRQGFHLPAGEVQPQGLIEACERFPEKLLAPARYGEQLAYWFEHLPRERFLILDFDDIKARPAQVLQQLFQFLTVDPDFVPAAMVQRGGESRQGTSPKGPQALKAQQAIYRLLNGPYSSLKRLIGVRRADALKRGLRARELMEKLFRRPGYPAMTVEERAYVHARLADDLELLTALTGLAWPARGSQSRADSAP